jgi:endonuclease YncB( thermonuclease family)
MKSTFIVRPALIALALIVWALPAGAATLQAKVSEVQSGDVLVVSNIKRPVRIKLKAIAAPVNGQPFSDIALEHLKMLVLDREVIVDYTHLADGYLLAKVIRDGIDIGAQMIRDGVAWYDRAKGFELREADRDLYAQCELAARNEKRGLWQDGSAVAPWEFRQAQLAMATPSIRVNSRADSDPFARERPIRRSGNSSALSSDDLLVATVGPGSLAGNPILRRISTNGTPGRWTRFESANGHFSVLFPSDGVEVTYTVLDAHGKAAAAQYLAGGDYGTMYLLMSMKGDKGIETDASAVADTIKGFVAGINRQLHQAGFAVTAKPSRELTINGYSGRQFVLNSELFSGTARVVSKQIGDQREVFMLCVLNAPGIEPSGAQFLNSFKISGN